MMCSIGGPKFEAVYNYIGRGDLIAEYGGDGEEASAKRADNLAMLNQIFADWAIEKTADELVDIIHELHIPCGVVKEVVDLLDDPHLKARNMVVEIDHPKLGKIKTYNMPIMYDGKSMGIEAKDNPLDPEIGQSNQDVLQEVLGLSTDEIGNLYETGALWSR